MPDEDRRLVERVDLLLVVIDDLGQAESFDLVRARAKLLDVSLLAGPLRCGDVEAAGLEVVDECLPAARRELRAVDEHERRLVSGSGFH